MFVSMPVLRTVKQNLSQVLMNIAGWILKSHNQLIIDL
jgi:hypothetical protein